MAVYHKQVPTTAGKDKSVLEYEEFKIYVEENKGYAMEKVSYSWDYAKEDKEKSTTE